MRALKSEKNFLDVEMTDKKIYVGGLREDSQKEEIEETFSKFGEIENVWVARKPAGFAFVVC